MVDRLIPPLSPAEIRLWLQRPEGYEAVLKYWEQHEAAIREAKEDPLHHGFELPFWYDVRDLFGKKNELYALGGNGTGKTEIGGKLTAEILCSTSGMKVLCVAQNEAASKINQQAAVYKYLPVHARAVNEAAGGRRRHVIQKINYSQTGGFTEATFALMTRSQCWFKTVEQYLRDSLSFEGPEYDLVWIDEPAPIKLIETLRYRVGKRGGKILLTFTAVDGFDAVCQGALTGAKVLKTLPMNWQWDVTPELMSNAAVELPMERRGRAAPEILIPELKHEEVQVKGCPPGHMPFLMQPLDPNKGVVFMWTQWNVFLPRDKKNQAIPSVFDKAVGKSKGTVRVRLFGWAEKTSDCQFPNFNASVHVVSPERVPAEGTDYHSADPAMARSYFMLWVRVDSWGRKFVYDESPRMEEGEWVTADGNRGDGQKLYAGRGSRFYKQYIRTREHEHGRQPIRRKGDPRAFAMKSAADDGGKNLFEIFQSADAHEPNSEDFAPMYFEPAMVRNRIALEIEVLNDAFAYDESRELSVENEPRLFISERCQNLIQAIVNWHPDQGEDSPWKDPIDALRYLFDEDLPYIDPKIPEVVGGRGW